MIPDMLPVATSTLTTFLSDNFTVSFDVFLSIMTTILPYLITVAIVFLFWRLARSFFHR